MFEHLLELFVLYLVIFDPFTSLAVFSLATGSRTSSERRKIAILAVAVAGVISLLVLLLGRTLIDLFSTTITDLRIAGGIILVILGIDMALGRSLSNEEKYRENSSAAIAAIIGSPLLAGPASITTMIITSTDLGILETGVAVSVVLVLTGALLLLSTRAKHFLNNTVIQLISAVMGMITLAWGVRFIREGLVALQVL